MSMGPHAEAELARGFGLEILNFLFVKFENLVAVETDEVIVMLIVGNLIKSLARRINRAFLKNPGFDQHREISVERRLPHFGKLSMKGLKQILCAKVGAVPNEHVQDLHPGVAALQLLFVDERIELSSKRFNDFFNVLRPFVPAGNFSAAGRRFRRHRFHTPSSYHQIVCARAEFRPSSADGDSAMKTHLRWFFAAVLFFAFAGIAAAAEPKPFTTDACTGYPNGTRAEPMLWAKCCVRHDLEFWAGGRRSERLEADLALRNCVRATGQPLKAEIIYLGVRLGSLSPLKLPGMQWGNAWGKERRNTPLTRAEVSALKKSLREHSDLDLDVVTDFIRTCEARALPLPL